MTSCGMIVNMKKLFILKSNEKDFEKVVERQLKDNARTIESLRDYSLGKKEISTSNIERRLPNLRINQ